MNKVDVPALTKGLDLPIAGAADQRIVEGPRVATVGLIGDDYLGMRPTMLVSPGDRVKLGQPVFQDKKTPGVQFVSPAAGTVVAVNRGAKRKFASLVIERDGEDAETFASYPKTNLRELARDRVKENLRESGLWTAFRTRPYSKVPALETSPRAIFVTAMDTRPLAIDPALVLQYGENARYFIQGLHVLGTLTDGNLFLCKAPGSEIPGTDEPGVKTAEFGGPHPAGNPGTHIHFLCPVNASRTVWHIGYQDVMAIGCLFATGALMSDRFVSLAGPAVKAPQNIRTRLGASLDDLMQDALNDDAVRVISGSVWSGRTSQDPIGYLGRYHNQVTAIGEGSQRDFLGWAMPGGKKYSITRAFSSAFRRDPQPQAFSTLVQGSLRAIVPIGVYERVMPLDIIATALLKSLAVQDTETAQMLGCLELDEEDLALCTFVCPSKIEYGPMLRQCLTHIEKEG